MHWCLSFAMLFVSVMFAEAAFAFSYSTCLGERLKWDSNTVTLRASPVSFPVGPWRTALTTAVARFNLNPSQFRYNLVTDTGGVRRGNGDNEVWGSTDPTVLKGAPARAYTRWTCFWFFGDHVHMDEVDVVFDYGSPWQWSASEIKTNLSNYGGTLRPLHTTAIHEISHGLKLNHVNTEYNVMGQDFTHIHVNGATARAYLGEDASDGAVFLYGTSSPAREDVGVVHWKYSGASGEYSVHTKTQLFDSAGNVLPNFLDGGEDRYRVAAGQTVQAEFTYENNGANRQDNVAVGFYISTNDTITTADQRIGGITLNLGRGDVFTTRATLTIPATLPFDRDFWLGAVVDEAGAIGEILESNNATYIPIRTIGTRDRADLVPIESDCQVVIRVRNVGGVFAPPSITTVDFFEFGSVNVPTPGILPENFVDLGPIQIPPGCFNPDCGFRITVDSGDSVDEGPSGEGNNSAAGQCIG
jgi:hypothetical protein